VATVTTIAEQPKAAPAKDDNSAYLTIKSPMIGTFYRSSSPDKPLLVNVGDEIKAGKVVCIIEAMKLFNEIESEISGRIVKVLVDNASPVEYDQPLFLVEPI
jgi:acetyl-CoA carboxylase biotin carboxyl carrier protein